MNTFFANLTGRERALVLAAALFLLGFGLYGLGVRPLLAARARYQARIPAQQETLLWMQDASRQVRQLQAAGMGSRLSPGLSPLLAIDQSAKSLGLGPSIKRIEPQPNGTVRVWLEDAVFDDLPAWLALLREKHGITVAAMAANPQAEPGYVEARITFQAGTGQ